MADQSSRPRERRRPLSERRNREVLRLVSERAPTVKSPGPSLLLPRVRRRNHITTILGKLEVGERTQAAVKAKEFGVV